MMSGSGFSGVRYVVGGGCGDLWRIDRPKFKLGPVGDDCAFGVVVSHATLQDFRVSLLLAGPERQKV